MLNRHYILANEQHNHQKHQCPDCEGRCAHFNELLEKSVKCDTCNGMGVIRATKTK